MRVLIACEYTGIMRDSFAAQGHDAWSCDILPTERPGNHIQGDVREILNDGWDLMIAHPPCTYTSAAGYRWFKVQSDRMDKARQGFEFFMQMVNAPIPMICVENTEGLIWKWYRKPDQVVHPYQFGHAATKATCLWLKNLPLLYTTNRVYNVLDNWARNKEGAHNSKDRSRTFQGIADAMADQWGGEQVAGHQLPILEIFQ